MSHDRQGVEPLFISIGCSVDPLGPKKEQQLPTFLQKLAETKKVRALLIDGLFSDETYYCSAKIFSEKAEKINLKKTEEPNSYIHKDLPNLSIEIIGCVLPDEYAVFDYKDAFKTRFEEAIRHKLDKGGRVFIANHTQAWSFSDIPNIEELCNAIKQTHPLGGTNLQVYTQGGKREEVRCYLDQPGDHKRDNHAKDKKYGPQNNEFYECPSLSELGTIEQFKPDFKPTKILDIQEYKASATENSTWQRIHEFANNFASIEKEKRQSLRGSDDYKLNRIDALVLWLEQNKPQSEELIGNALVLLSHFCEERRLGFFSATSTPNLDEFINKNVDLKNSLQHATLKISAEELNTLRGTPEHLVNAIDTLVNPMSIKFNP